MVTKFGAPNSSLFVSWQSFANFTQQVLQYSHTAYIRWAVNAIWIYVSVYEIKFMHFHVIFYLTCHFFLRHLGGNMATGSCEGLKWFLNFFFTCQMFEKITIKQVYKFVNFRYTHYWGRCTNLYPLLIVSIRVNCTNLYTCAWVYTFVHPWLGERCTNLYTLDWERGVQICTLMPVFNQRICKLCKLLPKFKVNNACKLNVNLFQWQFASS